MFSVKICNSSTTIFFIYKVATFTENMYLCNYIKRFNDYEYDNKQHK